MKNKEHATECLSGIGKNISRRRFLNVMGSAAVLASNRTLLGNELERKLKFKGAKAKNCIMLWLPGGMGQIDTFDPKRVGDPKLKIAGSAYSSLATNVPEVRVSEHLSQCATIMDRMTAVRSVHHEVIDEHGAAVLRVHTGRPTSGTIQYPSIGSIVSHELGDRDSPYPAYVVIGSPSMARDPGFLGPQAGYLYVTDTEKGPNGLSRPDYIQDYRQKRREDILAELRTEKSIPGYVKDYDLMLESSLRMASPEFMNTFNLSREATDLRRSYGGELGQRCLLARRLIERGVKFVEISHNLNFTNGTGWDVHNEGLLKQHVLIRELDQALYALISDLEGRGKLDETLIVVGTEFGRPGEFDAGGGRGHYGKCFSLVLAGGGLAHKGAYGQTDDLAQEILENPVTIPDFHATILASLGIDPSKNLYAGKRPVPVTDGGKPIEVLFG